MKSARIGEMRTKIRFQSCVHGTDAEGYPTETWTDLFGGEHIWCQWTNVHGTETFSAMQLDLTDPATVTMRYLPGISVRCRIYRESDPQPYEIISIDNVNDRGTYLELKVKRVVKA